MSAMAGLPLEVAPVTLAATLTAAPRSRLQLADRLRRFRHSRASSLSRNDSDSDISLAGRVYEAASSLEARSFSVWARAGL